VTDQPMTYASSGVNYDAMDPFKRACQLAGLQTSANIRALANGEFGSHGSLQAERTRASLNRTEDTRKNGPKIE